MAEKIQKDQESSSLKPASPMPPSSFSWSTFLITFLFILALFVMFDNGMRLAFASAVGTIFNPLIGMNGTIPVITIFIAGCIMITFSTVVRHYYTDWVEQAKMQKMQAALQKVRMEALRKNDQAKLQKLQKYNTEIMTMNAKNMKTMFKTMGFTMFILIVFFAWLWLFLTSLNNQTFAVPWATSVLYMGNPFLFPNYMILYMLITIPVGMIIGRVLRHFYFKKRLASLDDGKRKNKYFENKEYTVENTNI